MPARRKTGGGDEPKDSTDRHKLPKTTFRFSKELADWLDGVCKFEERNRHQVVVRALRAYARANNYDWPSELPDPEREKPPKKEE
jgi:hypothetical protein